MRTTDLGAVFKEIQRIYAFAEAQDQTACDDSRNQRGEYLCRNGRRPLENILVGPGCLLHRILGHSLDARHRSEVLIELAHRVADDDLELSRLGEAPLHHLHGLDSFHIRLLGLHQHEAHARHAVRYGADAVYLGDEDQKRIYLTFDAGYENGATEKILDALGGSFGTARDDKHFAAEFTLPMKQTEKRI